jgi:uncharacterized membrane protein YedE/YeeE
MLGRLPTVVQDLLNLGLGFYLATGALALFANWNSDHRTAVIMILLIGLVIVFFLGVLATGLALLVFKPKKEAGAPKQLAP